MARRAIRSVSTPIVLTSIAVSLGITMLVGWTLVIAHSFLRGTESTGGVWLLVLGIGSMGFVVVVLIMFGISLVREILESRRQVSFIDSVTHELKSPLASLQLCLQTMARPEISGGQRADLQRMMEADVGRLAAFIDDILHASRVTQGRNISSVTEFDLAALLRESAAHVAARHGMGLERVRVEVQGGDLVLATDRTALRVIVDNLIDNALKYSKRPADVKVSARRTKKGRALLEVSDRGIGIERRDLKKVFHRFYRVPDEAVRSRAGTGLGLYVVSAMVKGLGGGVSARSEGRGRGSAFTVMLPRRVVRGSGRGDAGAPEEAYLVEGEQADRAQSGSGRSRNR